LIKGLRAVRFGSVRTPQYFPPAARPPSPVRDDLPCVANDNVAGSSGRIISPATNAPLHDAGLHYFTTFI